MTKENNDNNSLDPIAFGLSEFDMVIIVGALRTHASYAHAVGADKEAAITAALGMRLCELLEKACAVSEIKAGATVQ